MRMKRSSLPAVKTRSFFFQPAAVFVFREEAERCLFSNPDFDAV